MNLLVSLEGRFFVHVPEKKPPRGSSWCRHFRSFLPPNQQIRYFQSQGRHMLVAVLEGGLPPKGFEPLDEERSKVGRISTSTRKRILAGAAAALFPPSNLPKNPILCSSPPNPASNNPHTAMALKRGIIAILNPLHAAENSTTRGPSADRIRHAPQGVRSSQTGSTYPLLPNALVADN